MNKKAFVLMETIVVIVVISVALLTIFASYNKILVKVKKENKYDTSEYIYMTNYIKKYLGPNGQNCVSDIEIFSMDATTGDPKNFFAETDCAFSNNPFNIKKIHILKNINATNMESNLKKFDAYMIDYIRKLDVGDKDTIIIVEYERNALDDKGNDKKDSNRKQLTETYIASLEW